MEQLIGQSAGIAVHIAMGVALAACAGLRAFLPLLVVGLAGRLDYLPLSDSFEWLSTTPALVVFASAVVAELLGDKFPVVDHFLDGFQTIVKPIAGGMVMASVVAEWAPLYVTVAATIGGGSIAGLVHLGKANVRLVSTAATVGTGNPLLSLAEDVGSLAGSLLALVIPFVVAAVALGLLLLSWLVVRRLGRRRRLA